MSQQVSEEIKNQWREKVFNQSQSSLSIAAWCRQNNISIYTFYYWRNKFSQAPIQRCDFREIPEQQNDNNQNQKSGVYLKYQKFSIDLDQQFDTETLRRCLEVLKEILC